MIVETEAQRPEPPGFGRHVERIGLEILGARPIEDDWVEIRLRLRNGTAWVVTPKCLAIWSRNVGWYAWKDDMADTSIRFLGGCENRPIEPGESADLLLAVTPRSARRGSRRPARRIRLELSFRDEEGVSRKVESNAWDVASGGSVPPGSKSGCLGALFGFLG